jgi:hypothetical protein
MVEANHVDSVNAVGIAQDNDRNLINHHRQTAVAVAHPTACQFSQSNPQRFPRIAMVPVAQCRTMHPE